MIMEIVWIFVSLFLSIVFHHSHVVCCNRLACPLCVIDELLRRCEKKHIHLRVVYDIACVVASHLHVSKSLNSCVKVNYCFDKKH